MAFSGGSETDGGIEDGLVGAGEGVGALRGRVAAGGAVGAEAVAGNGDAEGACATGGGGAWLVCASTESPLVMPSMLPATESSSFGASVVKGWLIGGATSS